MADGPGVVGITGANGYLGSAVASAFAAKGWVVVALVRRPEDSTQQFSRHYDACAPLDEDLLRGIDVLVHCAYDMRARTLADIWRINVDGASRLLDAAKGQVARTLVFSSMSAYAGTRQLYGRAKLAIEQHAAYAGASLIRPGLVYGPAAGGMVAALARLTKLPIVPLLGRNSHQFTVHEDDLVAAVEAIVTCEDPVTVPVGVAHPDPVPFRDILTALATTQHRQARFVPVSWRAAYAGMRVAEAMQVPLPVRADSVLGLARPAALVPNVDILTTLGVRLRPFTVEGLPISTAVTGPDPVLG